MTNIKINKRNNSKNREGIVLLVTLVLLVVMSTLGYTLSSRVAARRYRNQYIIDYSKARYSCDSAVKYAMANLEDIEPWLISRPNEPDFSDLYALDENGYRQVLQQWGFDSESATSDEKDYSDSNKQYSSFIRGPYGPAWPFITEPVEFELDSANVRIEIQDENAKYPIGWVLLDNKQIEREIEAGYLTFCEMMGMSKGQIESLRSQLAYIGRIRSFNVEFKPITTTVRTPISTTGSSANRTTPTAQIRRITQSVSSQINEQTTNFAKLFHSTLLDTEILARPIIVAGDREESALKYIGIWGSRQVNINTAPRHVLEAAFIFGGNEVKIADEIIRQRRIEPFSNIADLEKKLPNYSGSIEKSQEFITTTSSLFTIKVTAVSGIAQASTIVAVIKDGRDMRRIALINS